MTDQIEWVALSIFIFFFLLVTVMGFVAARWKAGPVSEHLDEWGLGGRQFGTWITWFLVGGDFYTAYTVSRYRRWSMRSAPTASSRCLTRSSSIPSCLL
jgi:hypothetical protein